MFGQKKKRDVLREAAESLDNPHIDERMGVVHGTRDSLPFCFRLTSRGGGSSSTTWTEIDVDLGTEEVSLTLREQTQRAERDLRDGLAIDLITGDPRFDEAYIVEGAPQAIVVGTLEDDDLRERLLGLLHARGAGVEMADPTTIRVHRPGWLPAEAVESHIALATLLASRILEVHANLDERAANDGQGAYRGGSGRAAIDRARDERAGELEELRRVQGARAKRDGLAGIAVLIIFAILAGVILIFGHTD